MGGVTKARLVTKPLRLMNGRGVELVGFLTPRPLRKIRYTPIRSTEYVINTFFSQAANCSKIRFLYLNVYYNNEQSSDAYLVTICLPGDNRWFIPYDL